jgi:hypothetical protein
MALVVRCEKGRILRHRRWQRAGFAGFALALAIWLGIGEIDRGPVVF